MSLALPFKVFELSCPVEAITGWYFGWHLGYADHSVITPPQCAVWPQDWISGGDA